MDRSIMFGPADPGWAPSLAEVGEEMSALVGVRLEPVSTKDMLHGTLDGKHAWLTTTKADNEPFCSHPFDLEIGTSEPVEPLLHALFDRLAEQGRYRLMLMFDDECVRSTHFPCHEW